MPTLRGTNDLRDAVEALDSGRANAADLERSIRDALSNGVVTHDEVVEAMRNSATQSAATEIIARLATEKVSAGVHAEQTESRPPNAAPTSPRSDSNRRRPDTVPNGALTTDAKMIGQILGDRYRLDRQLESGVLGAVYLGADLEANEASFAVNVLRPEFGRFSEALALLRVEVRVCRMLRHPHIARVYSLNADSSGVYLVTEYLEGRSLEAILPEFATGLPLKEARGVIADVCMALAYAHDLDVVHGDLQPANVYITHSDRAKLLHFGLSRAAATRNGRFDPRRVGGQTIAYAGPEMLQGGAPDPRDDVYSLGCLIYTILSGAHPFESRSAVEARNLALVFTPLEILSRDQNSALGQALTFERDRRTPSVTALLAGLGWSDGPPAAAAPADTPTAISARTPMSAESDSPAGPVAPQPIVPRPRRKSPGRLPLPSIKATERLAPPAQESRRTVMPALIVLSLLLVVVGIGIYVYRDHSTSARTQPPRSALNPLPPASPIATPPSNAVATPSTPSPPLASTVAGSRIANPPAVAGTKIASSMPIPVLRPLPKAAAAMADSDNCPYPKEAVAQGLTGTVSVLVYVASDGRPTKTKMDKTSGSDILDQAAVRCVEQFGRFPAPPSDSSSAGYWGRLRFKWSFGP